MTDEASGREPETQTNVSGDSKADWGIAEALIGLVLLFVMSAFVAGLWQTVSGEDGRGPLSLTELLFGLLGGWIAFFGTAFYVAHGKPGGFKGQLGYHFEPVDFGKGAVTGLCGQLLVVLIYLPVQIFDSKTADSVSDVAKNQTAAAHGWRWLPYALAIAVISPCMEELFFRGVVLRAFSRRWGVISGIVISGLIFGAAHFEGIQTPALVAFGWLLGWRASKTGRIGETIVAHATFNAFTLVALATS